MTLGARAAAGALLFGLAVVGGVEGQEPAGTRSIRGVAYDSLRMRPLAGALLSLERSGLSTISDDSGRFGFGSLSATVHVVLMQHDALDAVGVGFVRGEADLRGSDATLRLAVPSFRALWARYCPGSSAPRDSGVVFGVLRATGTGAGTAGLVQATWLDVAFDRKAGISQARVGGSVEAAANGHYAMCGVPNGALLQMRARTPHSSTDWIDVAHVAPGITRRDLLVASRADTGRRVPAAGVVRAPNGQAVPRARVQPLGGAEVIAGDDGTFVLRDLRPGTRAISVRAIGSEPSTGSVDADIADTSRAEITIGRVAMLDSVLVEVSIVQRRFLAELQYRQSLGIAKFVDSTSVERLGSVVSALRSRANVRQMKDGTLEIGARCIPREMAVWIDRQYIKREDVPAELRLVNVSAVASIEIYEHRGAIPPEFFAPNFNERMTNCAIIIWTKRMLP